MKGVIAHYGLAGLSIIALVIINIWGKQDASLNNALIGVVAAAAVWGGIQRNAGIPRVNPKDDEDTDSPK